MTTNLNGHKPQSPHIKYTMATLDMCFLATS